GGRPRSPGGGEDARVPRALPRAPRRALPPRRDRPRPAADPRAPAPAGGAGGGRRGDRRHQSRRGGGGDCSLSDETPASDGNSRDEVRPGGSHRGRPGVCGSGDTREGALGPKGNLGESEASALGREGAGQAAEEAASSRSPK